MIIIYHNPRCSKSRQTLELLEKSGQPFETVLYLKEGVPFETLEKAIATFGEKAMVRKTETDFKERIKGFYVSTPGLVKLMLKYPRTIQRPLVVNESKMAIGRPPESILEIL